MYSFGLLSIVKVLTFVTQYIIAQSRPLNWLLQLELLLFEIKSQLLGANLMGI